MRYLAALIIGYVLLSVAPAHAATYAYIPSDGAGVDSVTRVDPSTDPPTFETYSFTDGDADNDPDPYGAAVTPDGFSIWVTLNGFDQVVRLTNSSFFGGGIVTVNLPAGSQPQGVAVDTEGHYAYVANYGHDNVSKIDLGTYTVDGDPIDVGGGPRGIAAFYDSSDGECRVYVANFNAGTLTVITDGDSSISTETISAAGSGPLGLALAPDGGTLYVSLYHDDRVAVIRTSDNRVIDLIGVGDGPWGVAVGQEGAYLYVSNSLDGTASVIETATQTVALTLRVGSTPLGLAAPKYGDFAYVVNQADNSISRIDMADESVEEIGTDEIEGAFALGAFIGGTRPSAPSGLGAVEMSYDTIELTWTDNASDELGFKVERRLADEEAYTVIADLAADTTSYTDDSLDGAKTYTYRIRAYNEVTESAYTAEATATTEEGSFSWCFIGSLLP